MLSPAHESEMRGYLVYVPIVYRGIFDKFFETFIEGSVDRVMYRDYTVNRRFFIYCSLACSRCSLFSFFTFLAR